MGIFELQIGICQLYYLVSAGDAVACGGIDDSGVVYRLAKKDRFGLFLLSARNYFFVYFI